MFFLQCKTILPIWWEVFLIFGGIDIFKIWMPQSWDNVINHQTHLNYFKPSQILKKYILIFSRPSTRSERPSTSSSLREKGQPSPMSKSLSSDPTLWRSEKSWSHSRHASWRHWLSLSDARGTFSSNATGNCCRVASMGRNWGHSTTQQLKVQYLCYVYSITDIFKDG